MAVDSKFSLHYSVAWHEVDPFPYLYGGRSKESSDAWQNLEPRVAIEKFILGRPLSQEFKMNRLTTLTVVFMLALFSTDCCQAQGKAVVDYEAKLESMGLELMPVVAKPGAIYRRVVVVGNMAYTSGHISISAEGEIMKGKLGEDVAIEAGQAAAQRSAVAMLSSLKQELGSLNRIKRLVKTTGMVNCTPEFVGQSQVVNGFSQVFLDLMGQDHGVGARSAVGMSSLPLGAIVEVEAIFELRDE